MSTRKPQDKELHNPVKSTWGPVYRIKKLRWIKLADGFWRPIDIDVDLFDIRRGGRNKFILITHLDASRYGGTFNSLEAAKAAAQEDFEVYLFPMLEREGYVQYHPAEYDSEDQYDRVFNESYDNLVSQSNGKPRDKTI